MSVGLVLEGGGMRGIYTAGALEVLMEEDISFPYVIAVSAGACNATGYVARQKGRNYRVLTEYNQDKRYLSLHNLIKKKSLFDFDFVIDEIGTNLFPLNLEDMLNSNTIFKTGVTNIVTAKPMYFDKECYAEGFDILRASCSQPFVAPIINYQGLQLLDGGISDPIPIDKSIADGYEKNIIILTRHNGYQKKKEVSRAICNKVYKNYPHLVELLLKRDVMYNEKLEICNQLEREKKAIIIRPDEKLQVSRMEKSTKRLDEAYWCGRRDLEKKLQLIREFIQN